MLNKFLLHGHGIFLNSSACDGTLYMTAAEMNDLLKFG